MMLNKKNVFLILLSILLIMGLVILIIKTLRDNKTGSVDFLKDLDKQGLEQRKSIIEQLEHKLDKLQTKFKTQKNNFILIDNSKDFSECISWHQNKYKSRNLVILNELIKSLPDSNDQSIPILEYVKNKEAFSKKEFSNIKKLNFPFFTMSEDTIHKNKFGYSTYNDTKFLHILGPKATDLKEIDATIEDLSDYVFNLIIYAIHSFDFKFKNSNNVIIVPCDLFCSFAQPGVDSTDQIFSKKEFILRVKIALYSLDFDYHDSTILVLNLYEE